MTFPALRDSVSAPWFDGLARGVLLLHRCRECGHVSRPDVASCPACRSDNLTWVPSRGTGCVVAAILKRSQVWEVLFDEVSRERDVTGATDLDARDARALVDRVLERLRGLVRRPR